MKEKIEKLKNEILGSLAKVKEEKVLKDLEIKYLGRKGELTKILRSLKDLSEKEKKEIGQLANEIKKEIEDKFAEMKKVILGSSEKEQTDITLPGEKIERGHLNPITIVQNELEDLFTSLGFMVLDGPEL